MANDTTQKSPRRYENMRDSGVEWIGMIPSDWETKRLKFLGVARNGLTYSPADISDKSSGTLVIRSSNIQKGKLQFQDNVYVKSIIPQDLLLHQGDIVICARNGSKSLIGKSAYVDSSISATFGAFMMVFRTSVFEKKYIYWLLNSGIFNYYLGAYSTTTINQLTRENINNMYVPFCPFPMLRSSISNFLDEKCKQIDTVITEVKLSINAYNSWKSSIIYEAVTKGLDPNVEMKDSGIEWIGKMPKHWCDINPKALFSQRKEKAHPGDKQLTSSQQYGILFQKEYMELTGSKVVVVEKDFNILKHVENGDFVISMRSFQGGLEYSTKSGCISSAYVMLIPNLKLVYPRYFRWLFKSYGYIQALQSTSDLIRDGQAMRYSNFSQVRLIQVPLCEQEAIADYLDKKCTKIDDLIAEKQRLIEDLEAYKKSLIYEVVTGKRKVV